MTPREVDRSCLGDTAPLRASVAKRDRRGAKAPGGWFLRLSSKWVRVAVPNRPLVPGPALVHGRFSVQKAPTRNQFSTERKPQCTTSTSASPGASPPNGCLLIKDTGACILDSFALSSHTPRARLHVVWPSPTCRMVLAVGRHGGRGYRRYPVVSVARSARRSGSRGRPVYGRHCVS